MSALVCMAVCAWPQTTPQTPSEVQKAIDEFKIQTANQGLRDDGSAKTAPRHSPLLDWHGRLYENFRNDFLDAVPHEIVQNGGDKGLLRRNQYGFNVAGPFFIPGLTHGKSNTYISLSFEGVRERISRTSLRTIPTMEERTGDYSKGGGRGRQSPAHLRSEQHARPTRISIHRNRSRSTICNICAIRFRATGFPWTG